jgi:UPF0716 protein FxsA
MSIKKTIILALILLPIIEIFLFIEIGSMIGSFTTILIILLTAIYGVYLLKHDTWRYMAEIQNKVMRGMKPDQEVLAGIINFICGLLLFIPGFLTDILAFILLLKPFRTLVIQKFMTAKPFYNKPTRGGKTIIDVDHSKDD